MLTIFLWACVPAHTYNRSYSSDFPKHYREVVSTWEGKSVDDLLMRWGSPYQTIAISDEIIIYEYFESSEKIRVDSLVGEASLSLQSTSYSSSCFTRFKADGSGTIIKTDVWGSFCSSWIEPQKSEASQSNKTYVD